MKKFIQIFNSLVGIVAIAFLFAQFTNTVVKVAVYDLAQANFDNRVAVASFVDHNQGKVLGVTNSVALAATTPVPCVDGSACPPSVFTLTVTKSGSGQGTVADSSGGINCGSICSATYTSGVSVTLSATPTTGSVFSGWSGGSCSGTGTCVVNLTANTTITANLTTSATSTVPTMITGDVTNPTIISGKPQVTLNGQATANGLATVASFYYVKSSTCSSVPTCYDIRYDLKSCGPPNLSYPVANIAGTDINKPYSIVSGDSEVPSLVGGSQYYYCAYGSNSKGYSYGGVKTFTTTGTSSNYSLTVTKSGTGSGTVTSSPAGISCSTDCSESYTSGTNVTLTATVASDSTFAGWSGDCSGTGTCLLTMNSGKNVVATFSINTPLAATYKITADPISSNIIGGVSTIVSVFSLTNQSSENARLASIKLTRGGNIAGHVAVTDHAKIYDYTSGNLGSLLGTGGDWSGTAAGSTVTVTLDTPFTITAGTTAKIVVTVNTASATANDLFQISLSGASDVNLRSAVTNIAFSPDSSVTWPVYGPMMNFGMSPISTLYVVKAGTGSGTVFEGSVLEPGSVINCGSVCSASFLNGVSVTLNVTPSIGSVFTGWSGACTGTGTCTLTMNSNKNVTATFSAAILTHGVDLTISDVAITRSSPGPTPSVGDIYLYGTVTLKNLGDQTAIINPEIRDVIFGSINYPPTDTRAVQISGFSTGTGTITIEPGGSKTLDLITVQNDEAFRTRTGFLATAGPLTLYFMVDAHNNVSEANETNNVYTHTLNILPASGTNASIKLISPQGGEQFSDPLSLKIQWSTYFYSSDRVYFYMLDQDATGKWSPGVKRLNGLGGSLAATGTWGPTNYTVGSFVGTHKIRGSNNPNEIKGMCLNPNFDPNSDCPTNVIPQIYAFDDSDMPFTVGTKTTTNINIITPNGGEQWEIGKTYQIRWNVTNITYPLQIVLTNPKSGYYKVIASNLPGASTVSYSWTIASDIPVGYGYTIGVGGQIGGQIIEFSDLPFSIVSETLTQQSTMKAPTAGNYAFKMKWYRSVAASYMFNAKNMIDLVEPASAGATSIKTSVALDPNKNYVIFNPDLNHVEKLDVDTSSDSTSVQLKKPLGGNYTVSSKTKIVSLLGIYWGWCPTVIGPVDLGYYNAGEEILIGEVTNYYNDVLEPLYSNNSEFFFLEQGTDGKYQAVIDEGKHLGGWKGIGIKEGYDDGGFEVYQAPTAITNITVPLPVAGTNQTPYCGFGTDTSSQTTTPTITTTPATPTEVLIQERIKKLEYKVSELEQQLVATEKKLVQQIDKQLTNRVAGKILLQVEGNGEAWYVDKDTQKKFYLKDGNTAYTALQVFGLGISNENLAKIPVATSEQVVIKDSDGDGLDDQFETAIGTDPMNKDTDNDGYTDSVEVTNGYSPLGLGKTAIDANLVKRLEGKIILAVNKHGEAFYISNGIAYYLKDGLSAYQIMRNKSLGITNNDLRKIQVGEFE
ncbi:MAG: Ser-Thr-rich GPI-anchored membrane family protein [Patescibacteria group bacterium]